MSNADEVKRLPRFSDTAAAALSADDVDVARKLAEVYVTARRFLLAVAEQVMGCTEATQMHQLIDDQLDDIAVAVKLFSSTASYAGGTAPREKMLHKFRERGVSDEVIERIRLGLIAADDEASLLGRVPGGLDAHPELLKEDARGRFIWIALTSWLSSDDDKPQIWDELTFAFLDTAGRAFGLASAAVADSSDSWSAKVA